MKRKSLYAGLLLFFGIFLVSGSVLAGHHGPAGKGANKGWGLDKKIMKKVHFMKMNQEELGLSDEAIDKLIDLKLQAKKTSITKRAEIDLVGVDFKAALYDYPVDQKKLEQLVDQKLAIKKEMAKELISIYAQVRGALSEEQNDKMKEIWYAQKKGKTCGH